jgi:hypothetical protein
MPQPPLHQQGVQPFGIPVNLLPALLAPLLPLVVG